MSEWIRTQDTLPPVGKAVLLLLEYEGELVYDVGQLAGDVVDRDGNKLGVYWTPADSYSSYGNDPLCWRELPAPPAEVAE